MDKTQKDSPDTMLIHDGFWKVYYNSDTMSLSEGPCYRLSTVDDVVLVSVYSCLEACLKSLRIYLQQNKDLEGLLCKTSECGDLSC